MQTADGQLGLLTAFSLRLARRRDLDSVVQMALDTGFELCSAEMGAFFYSSGRTDGKLFPAVKVCNIDASALRGVDVLPADSQDPGALREIFRSGDVQARGDGTLPPALAQLPLQKLGVRSLLALPVLAADGQVIGTLLYARRETRAFSEQDEELTAAIAAHAALAMENVRLSERLRHEASQANASQHRIAESERRLQQALAAGRLGTWTWNAATDNLDFDERAAEIFQTEAHRPMSRRELRRRAVHHDDLGQTPEDLREALKRGGVYSAEYRIETSNGSQIWVAARAIPTFAEGSTELTGMVGTLQDITERKAQETALRQSEKLAATGRLAATIAHEINNPLEAVTNLIFLCKTDPTVPPVIQRLLETADNELERVSQIAQQTLGFYRDTTRPIDIDLTELLEGVVNLFSRRLQYQRLTCRVEVDADLHTHGLKGEIRQVFSNLLVNAIDASGTGEIRIRARRRVVEGREGISVLIADQGSGIVPEVRERLFSPFFTTKESVGTGLGLWVTRGMVEKHGGTIRFRSRTKPPSGTVFRVFLPAKNTSPEAFPLPPQEFLQ